MSKYMYSYDTSDLTQTVNRAIEVFLDTLIENELAEEESKNYKVVIHDKGFFGSLFSKFFDDDNNQLRVTVVQIRN